MTEKYIENYKKYLDKWGDVVQMQMAIEEMSELTKEICKYIRYSTFESENVEKLETIKQDLMGEIADVINMAEQLELCFGIDEIEKIRSQKILRTDKLVESEE